MSAANLKLAKKYARALFELYTPMDLDAAGAGLSELAATVGASHELLRILRHPLVDFERRAAVLREICARLRPGDRILANFAEQLLKNNHLPLLPLTALSFKSILDRYRQLLTLQVVSAFDLGEHERDAFTERIRALAGPLVEIHWYVNPEIIGGLVVRAGDRVLDASLHGCLERLRAGLAA